MKITNNGVSQASVTPPQGTPGAAPTQRDDAVDGAAQEGDGYTPSAEWLRLVDLVKQEPAIREDRVLEVAQRLQNGEYMSRESAEKTADAMLNSID
jgi:anti-sigma28 factor (negative regulator of flagellin synthesis)